MKNVLLLFVSVAVVLSSCQKMGQQSTDNAEDNLGAYNVGHDMIVLGDRLEDPYSISNVTKAVESLYPTKAGRVDVAATDLYVRFLPKSEDEYNILIKSGIVTMDHPLDYAIVKDGDYYHDPTLPEDHITWQYAVVKKSMVLPPGIEHEILDECFIPSETTKGGEIDWEAVEREAYRLTGNSDMILPKTKSESARPKGRITIVDENANGGKPFGVAGVKIVCNSFVKFASTYTDRDGYYEIDRTYSSNVRYRLMFTNVKKFAIGLNLLLVPASMSTLGKASPSGVDVTIDRNSDRKLFARSVVNNAAYDFYSRCAKEDMSIVLPPEDLRFWLLYNAKASHTLMMKQGAGQLEELAGMINSFYSEIVTALRIFMPDIILGLKDESGYNEIYSETCHELAHASHFSKVGKYYWDKFLNATLLSFLPAGCLSFLPNVPDAGFCEVGEMWAYFMENLMYRERYVEQIQTNGLNYWFKPQIMMALYDKGMSRSQIFSALTAEVDSKEKFLQTLTAMYPEHTVLIEQVRNRYQ